MSCCRNQEVNAESSTDDGGLPGKVSERNKDSIEVIYLPFCIKTLQDLSTGAEKSGEIKKKPEPLK